MSIQSWIRDPLIEVVSSIGRSRRPYPLTDGRLHEEIESADYRPRRLRSEPRELRESRNSVVKIGVTSPIMTGPPRARYERSFRRRSLPIRVCCSPAMSLLLEPASRKPQERGPR